MGAGDHRTGRPGAVALPVRPAKPRRSGALTRACAAWAVGPALCGALLFIDPPPARAQLPGKKRYTTGDTSPLYHRIRVEGFENSPWGKANLVAGTNARAEIEVSIEEQFAAPVRGSVKYLVVRSRGELSDMLSLAPSQKLRIPSLCRSISVWVYGMNTGGVLSMIVRDNRDARHRISFGTLNFLGWKELTAAIPDETRQTSDALGQSHEIEIERINYQRGSGVQRDEIIGFFLDEITALVREEYKDLKRKEW
ncbi:MAG: hypothetical protein EPN93_19880 [Spirochaetes bacterium]|nr:MAG: hypothetical protein EPN93_19880 [Spirochaetota bacterium]